MKYALILLYFSLTMAKAQDTIVWEAGYKLKLSDFQSPSSKIGGDTYRLETGSQIDFHYHLSEEAFKKIKNFNPKVHCKFKRSAAALIAPDTMNAQNLVRFSQYDFDLTELYSRKLRKQLHEEKHKYSNINFFKAIFERIQAELNERRNTAGQETQLGRDKKKLKALHSEVLKEIDTYPNYCKDCEIDKKKNKKKV